MRILRVMISQPARRVRNVAIVIVAAFSVAGCSSTTAGYEHAGQKAATFALGQVGGPYRYGGSSPTGFDCSGLVQYSYASAGISVPRTTSGQWTQMTPVRDRDMRAGDLLFFEISGKMSHVGLYLGDGRFVHAPSSGRSVSIGSLESAYYGKAFIRAGRPR
jgi:cell wall-associated NlpC family hydrolase